MIRTVLLGLLSSGLVGCTAAQRRDTEKRIADVLITDEQEFQLGFQVHEELKKQNIKFLQDPQVEGYVEQLTRKLAAEANKERSVEWRTYVIDEPDVVNAFATPGGTELGVAPLQTIKAQLGKK